MCAYMWYHHSSLIEITAADLMANCQQKAKRDLSESVALILMIHGGAIRCMCIVDLNLGATQNESTFVVWKRRTVKVATWRSHPHRDGWELYTVESNGQNKGEFLIWFWRWFANLAGWSRGSYGRRHRLYIRGGDSSNGCLTIYYIPHRIDIGSRVSALEGCQQVGIVAD